MPFFVSFTAPEGARAKRFGGVGARAAILAARAARAGEAACAARAGQTRGNER